MKGKIYRDMFEPIKSKLFGFFVLISIINHSCATSENTDIKQVSVFGNIEGLATGKAVLARLNLNNNETVYLDTTKITDNQFAFLRPAEAAYLHSIILNDSIKFPFFLEQTAIQINGRINADTFQLEKINSGPEDQLFRKFHLDSIFAAHTGNIIMHNYPDRIFAAFTAFYQFQLYNLPVDTMDQIMNAFSSEVKASEYYRQLLPLYQNLRQTAIGQVAPSFSAPDAEGTLYTLEDFRGKYLLLDFWASWCAPCRQENPKWVAFYNQADKARFEIIGISVDHVAKNWKKAIQTDGLKWTNLSTTSGWDSISVKYGVKAVPQNFLLDPSGKIIAKNISVEQLRKRLFKEL